MRALTFFVGLAGVIGYLTASAQTPDTPDFSGIYVSGTPIGTPTYTQPDAYPFTTEGEFRYSTFDPIAADPQQIDDCAGESVPQVIWGGNPMQITHEEGSILMRFESGDTRRTIYLDGTTPAADEPHTMTGFSTGRWVGTELHVETTHLQAGVLTNRGFPMSEDVRLSERYWRNPGENNLNMELVVLDPVHYTEPVTLTRQFVFSRDEEVRPWECVSLGPRFTEPDIDELARMLEAL